MLFAS